MRTISPRTSRLRCVTTAAIAMAAGGCGNPLFPELSDRGLDAPIDRLRRVEAADLNRYRKPPAPADATALGPARDRFGGLERRVLSLEEARASALTNNLDLRVALVDPAIAAQIQSEEEAKFDAAFTLVSRWTDLNQPTSSTLASAQNQRLFIEPGVRVPLRSGGTATVQLPWVQNEDNNAFSTLNPSYSSDLEFSISQPLLRNAGRRTATASIRIASYQRQATEARTKLEAIRQLAAVDRSYWRLYRARQELDVRQQEYEVAAEQEARARRVVQAGDASEIEIVRAQAGTAQRLEAIILAQNDVLTQQRELKRIVNSPELPIEGRTLVLPSSPPDPVEYEFAAPTLVAAALGNRMELLELELQLAADAATIAFQKNQALPLLTLDYTYRVNGLGGSSQDAFKQMGTTDFEDWELGLSADVPLSNEAAKSRVRRALLDRLQRLATREAREQAITQEVLAAIDQIDATWQRILAARQSVVLNTRALQAEQRLFETGESTSTNVLDAAARLADARSAEVRAVTDYQIAQVDLAFATGTLLGAARVSLEPAAAPDSDQPAPLETVPGAPVPLESPPAEAVPADAPPTPPAR